MFCLFTRRLKHHFLGKCWRGPRNFWSSWTCLGYGPEPGPIYKRPYATLILSVGRTTKYRLPPSSQTWQFGQTLLSTVLTLLYVLLIQYTCSTYFLFFRVFFLVPTWAQCLSIYSCLYLFNSIFKKPDYWDLFFVTKYACRTKWPKDSEWE